MAWMRQKPEAERQPAQQPSPTAPRAETMPRTANPAPAPKREPQMQQKMANVGQSVHIKGELTGKEDLTVEGTVEGRISLPANSLTIGTNGRVAAEIHAKSVEVLGQVQGNITAVDMVTIAPSGSVEGDLRSPRVAIADGARFRGGIDMENRSNAAAANAPQQRAAARPEAPKTPAAAAS